jgi:hypothetical protein
MAELLLLLLATDEEVEREERDFLPTLQKEIRQNYNVLDINDQR